MTTFMKRKTICMVCGRKSKHETIGSTNEFGPPDFDMRPPEMMRSTMSFWIQQCPKCNYCSPDIENGPEIARDVIKSDVYRNQLKDKSMPDLANRFLCWSMIQETAGNLRDAGWYALRAAWTCDDHKKTDQAVQCRLKVIDYFEKEMAKERPFNDGEGSEDVILADLYRRTGQFYEVQKICRLGLDKKLDTILAKALFMQGILAMQKDTRCYTFAGELQNPKDGKSSLPPDLFKNWENMSKWVSRIQEEV